MLDLGTTAGRTCRGPSRRALLKLGTLGALGLTFGDLLALRGRAGPAAPEARAKAVIVLWLWGGPSHLETFDPKPQAPLEYRGPFAAIDTAVPGIRVGELLPGLARRADKFALIRSMHHDSNDHGVAGTIALTGSKAGALDLGGNAAAGATRPSTGAIVSRIAGRRPGGLPPYVILGSPLHQGHKRVIGEGGGILGAAYDPFRIDYEPGVGPVLPDVRLPEGVAGERMAARWDLFERVAAPAGPAGRPATAMAEHYALARQLIASSESLEALEIDREPERIRAAYGPHRFGRCCLIARRLVEAGLPFVQVNWSTHVEGPEDTGDGGWDMHDRYFAVMQDRHGWIFDRALSALLDDLEGRGLLDSTIVLAVGEFGRTPKINDKAGRDHWNDCYSALIAGGGIRGGTVVGASDRRAEYPTESPVHPSDLSATILERLGIGSAELTGIGLTPMGTPIAGLT